MPRIVEVEEEASEGIMLPQPMRKIRERKQRNQPLIRKTKKPRRNTVLSLLFLELSQIVWKSGWFTVVLPST